jgi:hypothetical protein
VIKHQYIGLLHKDVAAMTMSFHAASGGRTRRVATTTERRGKDAALPRKLIEGPLHGKTAANRRVSARGDPSGRRGHDLISGVRVTRRLTCERKEAFLRLDQLLRIHRPLSVGRSALDGHVASELCDRQNLQA